MKIRPILFSGPMVRALLDGTKTQTRRVLNRVHGCGPVTQFGASTTKDYDWHFRDRELRWHDVSGAWLDCHLPYEKGDLLYVRETWAPLDALTHIDPGPTALIEKGFFRADDSVTDEELNRGWTPAIHQPRWASRITLEVTSVRVERVQEISESDARAEGIPNARYAVLPDISFKHLWNSINDKRGLGWDKNPYVVAVTFKVHRRNVDEFVRQQVA